MGTVARPASGVPTGALRLRDHRLAIWIPGCFERTSTCCVKIGKNMGGDVPPQPQKLSRDEEGSSSANSTTAFENSCGSESRDDPTSSKSKGHYVGRQADRMSAKRAMKGASE